MLDFDISVWLMTFVGLALGAWSIYWARSDADRVRALWGRRLFLLAMLELGATAFVAAFYHLIALAPMGLVSVFLVVAMLWETPAAQWQRE